MRMTVSLCVIMVEITNNLQLLPLIMLVLLISKAVGDAFNNGFYEEQVKLRSLPLLESRPQRFMRTLAAKDAISTRKVVQFSRVSKVSQIVAVLRSTDHNGFPVVDNLDTGEPVVIGLILRSYLLVLLQAKTDFQHNSLPGDIRGQISFRYNMRDFTKPVSSKGLSIYEINISPQEMDMYIDLQPFVNPTPYIVPEDMSLTKVYNLFRLLGLRHICVVPRPSQVVGVITRKDLLPEVLEEKNGLEELMSSRGRYFLPHDRNQPLLEDLM